MLNKKNIEMKLNDTNFSTHNIVSGFSRIPKHDFFIYAKGYKNAAQILAEELHERNGYGDYDGYPIIFLYRHAFELYLKGIIYNGARLLSFSGMGELSKGFDVPKNNKTHKLKDLSKKCTEVLLKNFPKEIWLQKICIEVEQLASEWTEIDKDSYSYRYPIDNEGDKSTNIHQLLNISSLAKRMGYIFDKLEEISFGIDVETDKIKALIDDATVLP